MATVMSSSRRTVIVAYPAISRCEPGYNHGGGKQDDGQDRLTRAPRTQSRRSFSMENPARGTCLSSKMKLVVRGIVSVHKGRFVQPQVRR
jgi:hypothetical protein